MTDSPRYMLCSVYGALSVCCTRLVLAMGPGNPPVVRGLTSGLVWFCLVPDPVQNPTHFALAGLLPGPDIKPQFFGRVIPGLQLHFTVRASFAPNMCLRSQRITTR